MAPISSGSPKAPVTVHMPYLAGLRGLTSLYVVLFHCQLLLNIRIGAETLSGVRLLLFNLLDNGRAAVAIFIVLSGYVLMLPVARSADRQLRGGFWYFMGRRARRILPPYYGALFLFSGLIGITQIRHIPTDFSGELTPASFLSHLFLVHNLSREWFHLIDAPTWSLATEWQIYFLFALGLLPLYRKVGILATIGVALLVGLLPHYLLPWSYNLDTARPWYLGLFGFGMGAACLHFGNQGQGYRVAARLPWGVLSFLFFALYIAVSYNKPAQSLPVFEEDWFKDVLCGLATAFLLLYCTGNLLQETGETRPAIAVRFLQSRPLLFLGTFSYSLYLFHQPLLDYTIQLLRHFHWSNGLVRLLGAASVPFVIGICYLCYWICERPFTSKKPSTSPPAAQN